MVSFVISLVALVLGNLAVIVNYQDIEVTVGLYFLFGNLFRRGNLV